MPWFDAPDLAAQKRIAADIQRETLETAPFLPTGQHFSSTAYRRRITDPVSEVFAFRGVRPA